MATMWHIAENNGLLGHGDKRRIVVGETLTINVPIFMCKHGLHACERLIDALAYANGTAICEVALGEDAYTEADKSVSASRACIAMTSPEEGERILRNFARSCALDVAHLWDMPENVLQYLETGDESVRSAAETAAWTASKSAADAASKSASMSAAWTEARSAAWTAGEAAADVASWTAAKSASRSAARAAADLTAWSAADAASRAAADAAAEAAAMSAAKSAAWTASDAASWIAAWTDAWTAVREKYNARLVEMVREEVQR